jgi:hypothetical protein
VKNFVLVLFAFVASSALVRASSESDATPVRKSDDVAEINLRASSQPAGVISHAKILIAVRSKIGQVINGFVAIKPIEPLRVADSQSPARIEPFGVWSKTIEVTTDGPVQPGKYPVLVLANLNWNDQDGPHTTTLVTFQDIEAAVLGESIMLAALGIPSFLVLPGFLIMTVLSFLSGIVGWIQKDGPLDLLPSKPAFWVIAITLSVLSAWVYPTWTRFVFGRSHNYTASYDLMDVGIVWFSGIVTGLSIFSAIVLARFGVRQISAWARAHRVFDEKDPPIDVLSKMAKIRKDLPPVLSLASFDKDINTGPERLRGLLVQIPGGQNWLLPIMKVERIDQKDRFAASQLESFRIDMPRLLHRQKGNIGSLETRLRQALDAALVTVIWEQRKGYVSKPTKVQQFEDEKRKLILVEEDYTPTVTRDWLD